MFCNLCYGLNLKRLIAAIIAVYAFIFVSDYCIHGLWLAETYKDTAPLWRPEAEMAGYMAFMLIGQLLVSVFPTIMFAKGYEGKGIGEGIRFGLLIGFFGAGYSFVQYAVTPLPPFLLWAWSGAGIVQGVGAGIIASLVYKKA